MSNVIDTGQYLNKWTVQDVSYLKRDLLLYSVGIGEEGLNFTYENSKDFEAFPTYPIVLSFKGTDQDALSFPSKAMMEGPRLPPLPGVVAGLDGERYIEKVNELPKDGAQLILKQRVAGIQKKGSGATVQMESLLEDKNGKLYYIMRGGTFLVGAKKGFTDSGENFSKKCPPPPRPPDIVEEMNVSKNQAHIYRLSGDYNSLHIDPVAAKMMGFPQGPILHGLCSLGFTTRAFVKHFCGGTGRNFKSIGLRFASPVMPGDTLLVNMWRDIDKPGRVVIQTTVKATGKVVIANAEGYFKAGSNKL
jgi:peroxisomal enoyl-CoA hydratase 2